LALANLALAEKTDPDDARRARAEADFQTLRALKLVPENDEVQKTARRSSRDAEAQRVTLLRVSFHASVDTGDRFGLPEAFRPKPPEYAGFNPKAQQKNKIPAKTIIKFRVAKAATCAMRQDVLLLRTPCGRAASRFRAQLVAKISLETAQKIDADRAVEI
jgi:hypothetical protein